MIVAELRGMTTSQLLEAIIGRCASRGILVMIDMHKCSEYNKESADELVRPRSPSRYTHRPCTYHAHTLDICQAVPIFCIRCSRFWWQWYDPYSPQREKYTYEKLVDGWRNVLNIVENHVSARRLLLRFGRIMSVRLDVDYVSCGDVCVVSGTFSQST
jgi:hypothetical protein